MNEVSPKITQETAAISDDDYLVIEQALLQNPRGRSFLAEYIQRNRPEDTKKLLSAIQRIENNLVKPENKKQQDDIDPIRMSIIEMAKAIAKTREEIKSIKPANEDDNHLINATEELSAIVESTENATNTILEAAEEIQEAAWVLREAGAQDEPCDQIDNKTTDIYTACSFQDITGQRTTKVVQALSYIENRVNAMIDIWGLNEFASEFTPREDQTDTRPDAHLLNGPSKTGEGLEQTHIDDMLVSEKGDETASIECGGKLADTISFDAIEAQDESVNPDEISFDKIEDDQDENAILDNDLEATNLTDENEPILDLEQSSIASTVHEENPLEQVDIDTATNTQQDLANEIPQDQEASLPKLQTSINTIDSPLHNEVDEINFVEDDLTSEMNDPAALSTEPINVDEQPLADLNFETDDSVAIVSEQSPLEQAPIDEISPPEQPKENDFDLSDIEVTDLDQTNEIEQSVSAVNPLEDLSSTHFEQELAPPKTEEEAMEMLNAKKTSSEIETKITTQEEFETLEELTPTTLSDEQKETLLN